VSERGILALRWCGRTDHAARPAAAIGSNGFYKRNGAARTSISSPSSPDHVSACWKPTVPQPTRGGRAGATRLRLVLGWNDLGWNFSRHTGGCREGSGPWQRNQGGIELASLSLAECAGKTARAFTDRTAAPSHEPIDVAQHVLTRPTHVLAGFCFMTTARIKIAAGSWLFRERSP